MAIEEIYIRNETETEARGPFNLEQLVTLAENGQVTAENLVTETDAADDLVEATLRSAIAEARIGFFLDDRPSWLADVMERLWIERES